MSDASKRSTRSTAVRLARDLRGLADATVPSGLKGMVMATVALGDAYARVETPLGPALVAFTAAGVSALSLEAAPAFERAHQHRTGRRAYPVATLPAPLAQAVTAHLDGQSPRSHLAFDLRGLSAFETAVLRAAATIPRGEVRPYGWIARAIGQPAAVRAVGSALGRNPIPLLIPCHRVVRADGSVGHYALGDDAKRRVLTAEGLDPAEMDERAAAGVRFHGSDTTHIFCYPTCRHARRTTVRHLMTFRSVAAAVAAGYRPCRICAPAALTTTG